LCKALYPEPTESGIRINTSCLMSQHVISATFLPQGHAVRRILAAATVEGYLRCEHHRFAQEARERPTYGVDILEEVGLALKGLKLSQSYGTYQDPLGGEGTLSTTFTGEGAYYLQSVFVIFCFCLPTFFFSLQPSRANVYKTRTLLLESCQTSYCYSSRL
jgi:hypothetical protein